MEDRSENLNREPAEVATARADGGHAKAQLAVNAHYDKKIGDTLELHRTP